MSDKKLYRAVASQFIPTIGGMTTWSPTEVDKLEISSLDDFASVVQDCRFFYKRDPIASTVVNKLVEIGITPLVFDQENLTDNEYRVFLGIRDELQQFIENCALEYLISGLVLPEIDYAPMSKEELVMMGVKKYNTLTMPTSMWLRDPLTVKIKSTMVLDRPSYYITIPDELIFFVLNNGKYPDGSEDAVLWAYLQTNYPEFIDAIKRGDRQIVYYNDLIVRRKPTTETPYPVPYLYAALESLKHKRNLRRMDYSIASRVISAIMLVKLGNDEFPILEEDEDAFASIREQMAWRNTSGKNLERIFQLFTNHTTEMEWIFPPVDALLNEKKYTEVNQDIFFSLGFPRILTTGEVEKTQTSDPDLAIVSPTKSMEKMQRDLLKIAKSIIYNIATKNKFKDVPSVKFEKISLYSIQSMLALMSSMLDSGNISRETYDNTFGYTYTEEVKKISNEKKQRIDLGIEQPIISPDEEEPNGSPKPGEKTRTPQQDVKQKQQNVIRNKTQQ